MPVNLSGRFMIVCQCNVIDTRDIEDVVHLRRGQAAVTPETVFAACVAEPICGLCRDLVIETIEEVERRKSKD